MKIQAIKNTTPYKIQPKVSAEVVAQAAPKSDILPHFYPASYYLNFLGGASLSLKDTISSLQNLSAKFPPKIEEIALSEISQGNPFDKKLIDIHQENYQELLECDTLDEIREKFPEFSDTISAETIEYNNNSFLEKWKKGEAKTKEGEVLFDPEKDLSVQLIQMYWGRGLSLSDIRKVTGQSLEGVLRKLNIPLKDKFYAQYLKLSDEKANEEITDAIRRNRTISESSSKRKGQPLSDEHKRKISEALKKYYAEHEYTAFYATDEDKKYFEKYPYQSEIFASVLLRAWGYKEANSIKKALSKYLKKSEIEAQQALLDPNQAQKMKDFWKNNEWARKNWSKCMTKSWTRQKELSAYGLIYEPKAKYDTPYDEVVDCANTLRDQVTIEEMEHIATIIIPDKRDVEISGNNFVPKEFRELIEKNQEALGKSTFALSAYYSTLQIFTTLLQNCLAARIKQGRANDDLYLEARSILLDFGLDNNIEEIFDNQDILSAYDMYCETLKRCVENKYSIFKTLFDDCIDYYNLMQRQPKKRNSKDFSDFIDKKAATFGKIKLPEPKQEQKPQITPLMNPAYFKKQF